MKDKKRYLLKTFLKTRVEILISGKINSKTKSIKIGKERHTITLKGSTQQEDIFLGNTNVPNIAVPKI